VPAPGAAPANTAPALPPAVNPALPPANRGSLKVTVPTDALVFVNGILTKSTGSERTYISRGLQAGMKYTYEVRAEAVREGQKLEETEVVTLKAGDNLALAFDNLQAAKTAETTLTLNVPAEAKVTLGGNATVGSGAERKFRTSKLTGNDAWSNYVVEVSIERGGRTVTQEKTVTLKAGDNQTLSFDFNDDQIAAR
jgi:uncharacterized protein (TIGR03000 family)